MHNSSASSPCLSPQALGYPLLRLQKALGWLGMLVLLAAFASLVDGLTAEMMRGPNRLDVLPGSTTPLSGPMPVKQADKSDFLVEGNSPDGQVRLELDDFFASYWFGSGMWRGRLVVGDRPGIGQYQMLVAFRDAPAKSVQDYRVIVWADAESMREGSFSRITREWGLSPFWVAGFLFPGGIFLALLNFLVGRQRNKHLRAALCGEVYKIMRGAKGSDAPLEVTFGLGQSHGVYVGQPCDIMRPDGQPVLEGVVAFCEPRHASLLLPPMADVRAGDVVRPLPASEAAAPVKPAATVPLSGVSLSPLRPPRNDA